ncbi:hypothetical protein EYR36_009266 [Pleurotus pulmonarius]|nr:hypothetical protein EYR36_009266 [Pleurotus pulmonarius]KAF4592765.1 hypothetical protein EYR38_008465 [Pleurotus pulmonarius]
MFAPLTALSVLAAALAARAIPTPSEPGPGDIFNEGATCRIVWGGDTGTTDDWKTMNIQLMTGDNFNMIPLTTLTTVDGTKAGQYEYKCLAVEPNSAIYFYQFSSPVDPEKTWTTRFTIAGPNGETVPPANARQPGTNDPIPWGVGKLVDESAATPPPTIGGVAGGGTPSSQVPTGGIASGSPAPSSSPSVQSSVDAQPPTVAPSSSPAAVSSTPSTTKIQAVQSPVSRSASSSSAAPTGSAVAVNENGAMGALATHPRVWLAACAFALAQLL